MQQSSDTTFRLFDWKSGRRRGEDACIAPGQAFEVIDFERGPFSKTSSDHRLGQLENAGSNARIFACGEQDANGLNARLNHAFRPNDEPVILMVTRGSIQLAGDGFDSQIAKLSKATRFFLPACIGDVTLALASDDAHVLEIRLP